MKSPITKLAAAAAVIAVVLLGSFEFLGGDSPSGVLWAEVVRKVQSSRGVIYRQSATSTKYTHTDESGYATIYHSATHYRSDGYQGGRLWITMYGDIEAGTRVVLLHRQKGYVREKMTLTDKGAQKHADLMDPRIWIQRFLSCKYSKLEQKTIGGVLCEGIETTDTALIDGPNFRIDSFLARLWVATETGLPVLLESTFKGEYDGESVMDQFQWDVELDASVFEANIPPDYEQM